MKITISIFLYCCVFALKGIILSGCAQTHQPAKAPSVAAVRQDLQAAKTHIEQAKTAIQAAGGDARSLDALIDKTDDKTVILTRFLETHKPKP